MRIAKTCAFEEIIQDKRRKIKSKELKPENKRGGKIHQNQKSSMCCSINLAHLSPFCSLQNCEFEELIKHEARKIKRTK